VDNGRIKANGGRIGRRLAAFADDDFFRDRGSSDWMARRIHSARRAGPDKNAAEPWRAHRFSSCREIGEHRPIAVGRISSLRFCVCLDGRAQEEFEAGSTDRLVYPAERGKKVSAMIRCSLRTDWLRSGR